MTSQTDRAAGLADELAQRRLLLDQAARGGALSEAVAHTSRELGMSVWVVTTTGRIVAAAEDPPPDAHLDAITRLALTSARLPAVATCPGDDAAYTVFDAERSSRRPLARRLVAADGSAECWPASTVSALGELAALADLDVGMRTSDSGLGRRVADAAVDLLATEDASRAHLYLRVLGLDIDAPTVVIAAGLARRSRPREDVRRVLEDAIAHTDMAGPTGPIVGAGGRDEVLALVQPEDAGGHERLPGSLSRALRRIGPGLPRDRLTAGVSKPAALASLGGAVRAARFARQLARDPRHPVEVVCDTDARSTRLLLNSVPDTLRTTFADGVLGPVVSYDARGAGDLIPTLVAFFECNSSWSRTADRLGVHINTVRYRIARIEQLTGRAVGQTDGWVDLYTALTLLHPPG